MTLVTDWVLTHPLVLTGCCILVLGHSFRKRRWTERCVMQVHMLLLPLYLHCTASFISHTKHFQASAMSVRCCRIHFLSVSLKCTLEIICSCQFLLHFRKHSCGLKIFMQVLMPCFRYPFKYSWYSNFYLFGALFSQKVMPYTYGVRSQEEHLQLSSVMYCNFFNS